MITPGIADELTPEVLRDRAPAGSHLRALRRMARTMGDWLDDGEVPDHWDDSTAEQAGGPLPQLP